MTVKNLLVELFVEELPPKVLEKLGRSFGTELHWALNRAGLVGDDVQLDKNIRFFASPLSLIHI
jgi:glycyl-tRNA synthetase beta chain